MANTPIKTGDLCYDEYRDVWFFVTKKDGQEIEGYALRKQRPHKTTSRRVKRVFREMGLSRSS